MKKIAYEQMYNNELTHGWYIGTRKILIDTISGQISKESKILDAGCGTGGTIKQLSKAGYKNVYGIDKSEVAISYCRKRNIKNVKKASIEKMPFQSNSFDAVICLDVLYHHGITKSKALKELKRVLKKGGILYSQEPAYNWLKSSHDIAIQTQTRFTRGEIKRILLKTGFKSIKTTYFNFLFLLPFIIYRLKNKLTKKKGSDVEELSALLNRALLTALTVETKLAKVINFPVGLSIISVAKK